MIHRTDDGLSEEVPAKRDMFGDPITVHKGLWREGDAGFVDAEIRRMAHEHDLHLGPPSPIIGDVDLREVTLKDGRNAYTALQDLAARPSSKAKPIKEIIGKVMKSPAYRKAPDSTTDTKGTKPWMIAGPMAQYRAAALRRIKADPNVREAMAEKQKAVAQHYREQSAKDRQAKGLKQLGEAFGADLSTGQ